MNNYTIIIERTKINAFLERIDIPRVEIKGEYIIHQFRSKTEELTVYTNKQNKPFKALYRGPKPITFFDGYDTKNNSENNANSVQAKVVTDIEHIGSDEVGFGDFFGPLIVVSAYIDKDIRSQLIKYDIKDSKKLNDQMILMMGQSIAALVPHSKNIVDNPKFNELTKSGYNMNKIKAMLHHNVLKSLAARQNYYGSLYIDKFTSEKSYKTYVAGMPAPQGKVILLESGEANSLAIATASVLARYYFLLEMDKLNKRFNTTIPLGAGTAVDVFARDFLKKNGPSNLKAICKHNFRNFRDLFEAN